MPIPLNLGLAGKTLRVAQMNVIMRLFDDSPIRVARQEPLKGFFLGLSAVLVPVLQQVEQKLFFSKFSKRFVKSKSKLKVKQSKVK